MNEENKIKSGFVGLIGRTNVGKSTLINKILKKKVLITSDKVQTTRNRIHCILNNKKSQIIFVDSPGFFKPRNLLQERLKGTAEGVIEDVDVIVVMVDIAGGIGGGDNFVFERIKDSPKPKILLLNKIDIAGGERVAEQRKKIEDTGYFDEIIEVSAKTGKNLDRFIEVLTDLLPYGPRYYSEDMISDQSTEKIISEIVREKLFEALSEETSMLDITDDLKKGKNEVEVRFLNIFSIPIPAGTSYKECASIIVDSDEVKKVCHSNEKNPEQALYIRTFYIFKKSS